MTIGYQPAVCQCGHVAGDHLAAYSQTGRQIGRCLACGCCAGFLEATASSSSAPAPAAARAAAAGPVKLHRPRDGQAQPFPRGKPA